MNRTAKAQRGATAKPNKFAEITKRAIHRTYRFLSLSPGRSRHKRWLKTDPNAIPVRNAPNKYAKLLATPPDANEYRRYQTISYESEMKPAAPAIKTARGNDSSPSEIWAGPESFLSVGPW